MNPWNIVAALCLSAVLLAGGFGAGWVVNGWRLERDAQEARAEKAEGVITQTQTALDRFGKKVDELGAIAKGGMENQAAIAAAAKRGSDEIKDWLAAHDGCRVTDDDVRLLRENDERRAAAIGASASH